MKYLTQAAKAVYATVAAGLGSLVSILVLPGASLATVSDGQWVSVALVAIIAGGGVYHITNSTPSV